MDWRSLVIWGLLLAAAFAPRHCSAGESAPNPELPIETDPSASVSKLPLEQFAGPHGARTKEILERPLVYRRGPIEVIACQPELLEYLVDHPAVAADYWKRLGLEVSEVESIPDGFRCRDGKRSSVSFHVVFASEELRVLYCIGEAKQPLLPAPLRAELVIVQRFRIARRADGRCYLVQQLEGFASAKGPALKAAMKLGKSVSQQVVDQCLQEMTIYFTVISRVMEIRPKWSLAGIAAIAGKRSGEDLARLESILRSLPDPATNNPRVAAQLAALRSAGLDPPDDEQESAIEAIEQVSAEDEAVASPMAGGPSTSVNPVP